MKASENETQGLGDRIGHLDTTTGPSPESPYKPKVWDTLRRQCTVVDAYSALIDLHDLQCGGVNVILQALSAVEMYVEADDPNTWGDEEGQWMHLFKGRDMVRRLRQELDAHLQFVETYADHISVAGTGTQLKEVVRSGRVALVLMLKSGWIDNDLDVLRQYHDWGFRVMALCHLAPFDWVDSSVEANETPGLSGFGRRVVHTCNELGMLVDLSHASHQTCRDALEATTRPLVATHSKCRALSGSDRDLPDDLMSAIAGTGGVVGILAPTARTSAESRQARLQRDKRQLEQFPDPFELAAAKLYDAEVWGTKLDLRHIDHAVELVGIDHVGLASHAQNSPQWRDFTKDLMQHGYSAEEACKILGGNMLRVLQESWA